MNSITERAIQILRLPSYTYVILLLLGGVLFQHLNARYVFYSSPKNKTYSIELEMVELNFTILSRYSPLNIAERIPRDTIPESNSSLDTIVANSTGAFIQDQIKYKADDYRRIDRANNRLYLYNNAELYYQDTELKAGIIVMDFELNEVSAGRIPDSTGILTQAPSFKQNENLIYPDSIRYNFDTEKALIWNSKSGQNGMDVFARLTKKENDSTFYLRDARVSTAGQLLGRDTEGLDYYFRVQKAKIIPGKQIITGFANMFIADIPTPVMVPFAYFPTQKNQESGFLFPSIGESINQGFHIQNGGYHFALSDYYDLTLTGDYYTNGSFGLRGNSHYVKRYKFSGNFSFRYERNITSERGLPNYGRSSVFNVRWSHRKDRKSNPKSNFSASVNFGSSNYFRESLNQLNSPNFLNNDLSSSISYSRSFPEYPKINISINANMSQNSQSQRVNLTLPTFQGNMERIFPFAPKKGVKKGLFQNINFRYSTRFENRIITQEDNLFKSEMFNNARIGAQHNIPLNTNFKVMKHLSFTVGSTIKEVWTPTTVRYNDFDPSLGEVVKDTISGFDRFTSYNLSASLGTTIYGVVNFKKGRKIESIRHTLRPSISYSNRPSSERYYDTYIIDADGNTKDYTRFEGSLFGTPSKALSNSMNISISNLFEAKVRDRDSTATEPKKIVLLKNFNISTAYDFAAEEFNWSPVRLSTGFDMIQKKLTMNFAATLDPYALDVNNRRINEFNSRVANGIFRLTSANANLNFSIDSGFFKSNKDEDFEDDSLSENQQENAFSGGRSDDLFGKANDFTNRGFNDDDQSEAPRYPSYRTRIPWDLRIAYTMTYINSTRQNTISNNSLMFSGNVNITPKWKVGISSGYDFKGKGFTYTQFRFDRDLDSWRLNFSWVPFSDRASWYFFIGVKSGLLSDIKYEKRREPDRNL